MANLGVDNSTWTQLDETVKAQKQKGKLHLFDHNAAKFLGNLVEYSRSYLSGHGYYDQ